LFGPKPNKSKGTFLKTILDKVLQGEKVSIYAHHRISVGYTPHVAKAILEGMTKSGNNIYHAVNSDLTSWHHFAYTAIKELPNFQSLLPLISIKPIEDEIYEVKRPQYSVLKNSLLEPLPNWKDAVAEFVKLNYLKS
jgi:dTDP-4-dehydrorhamnose reductase